MRWMERRDTTAGTGGVCGSFKKSINGVGSPPAPRVAVIQFDSPEKAVDTPAYKAAVAIEEKYAAFRCYIVEGVSP